VDRPKYWGRKRVAITDKSIGILQLLRGTCRGCPHPKSLRLWWSEV